MSCHRPPSQTGPAEARALRAMWCAVLVQAFKDMAEHCTNTDLNRYQVERWVGSRDFKLICELAGVEPGRAERAARRHLAENRAGDHTAIPNMRRGKRKTQQHMQEVAA